MLAGIPIVSNFSLLISPQNRFIVVNDFNQTIDIWIEALAQYNFIQLCTRPSPNSWSLGQMYKHLVDDTNFYIEQIKTCVASNEHAGEEASPGAKTMLLNNEFPDEIIDGNPANGFIPQPDNKEQLMRCLMKVKDEMNHARVLISESPHHGKTKHPELNYFSAGEWYQFADMHFRHHLRQKKRIDHFLKINGL